MIFHEVIARNGTQKSSPEKGPRQRLPEWVSMSWRPWKGFSWLRVPGKGSHGIGGIRKEKIPTEGPGCYVNHK